MSNVVNLPVITYLDINPDNIIRDLQQLPMETLLAVGFTESGEFFFHASMAEAGEALLHLEIARKKLLDSVDV